MLISDMVIPEPTITTARGQLNPNPTVITDTTDIPFTITLMPMPLLTLLLPLLLTVLLEFIPVVQLHPFQEVPKVWENKVFFLSNCSHLKIIKKNTHLLYIHHTPWLVTRSTSIFWSIWT